jgi:hypothetical protein
LRALAIPVVSWNILLDCDGTVDEGSNDMNKCCTTIPAGARTTSSAREIYKPPNAAYRHCARSRPAFFQAGVRRCR